MSRKLNRAPFAIASDGRVLLNLAAFDGTIEPSAVLGLGLTEPGCLFIAVELSASEVAAACERLGHGYEEAAAFALGRRQRIRRQRRQRRRVRRRSREQG